MAWQRALAVLFILFVTCGLAAAAPAPSATTCESRINECDPGDDVNDVEISMLQFDAVISAAHHHVETSQVAPTHALVLHNESSPVAAHPQERPTFQMVYRAVPVHAAAATVRLSDATSKTPLAYAQEPTHGPAMAGLGPQVAHSSEELVEGTATVGVEGTAIAEAAAGLAARERAMAAAAAKTATSATSRGAGTDALVYLLVIVLVLAVIVLGFIMIRIGNGRSGSQAAAQQHLTQGLKEGNDPELQPKDYFSPPASHRSVGSHSRHSPVGPMVQSFSGPTWGPLAAASLPPTAGPSSAVSLGGMAGAGPRSSGSLHSSTVTDPQGRPSTGSVDGNPDLPPPICPSLILPRTEARFMVKMQTLQQGISISTGSVLDILGTSRRKLLHASIVEENAGGRQLALASVGCEDNPRVFVRAGPVPLSMGDSDAPQSMEIHGRRGALYGTLEASSNGGATLHHGGRKVMSIEEGTSADMQMTASMVDGRTIATAGRSNDGHGDAWKLQVMPGADAILIASCMLALILLRPNQCPGQARVF